MKYLFPLLILALFCSLFWFLHMATIEFNAAAAQCAQKGGHLIETHSGRFCIMAPMEKM